MPVRKQGGGQVKFGDFAKIKSLQTTAGFRENLQRLGLAMPCDDVVAAGPDSPLGASLKVGPFTVGNRFAIQPMEGWDGHEDGKPSGNTIRRWRNFGLSGAKLIWGGEAVAVRHDGRANPNQLTMTADNQASIAALRDTLVAAHREAMGDDKDLVIGLQLTHSGRFCKPNDKAKMEPRRVGPCLARPKRNHGLANRIRCCLKVRRRPSRIWAIWWFISRARST